VTECCSNCRFFAELPDFTAVCRRRAPAGELFPGVAADDWCGEYESSKPLAPPTEARGTFAPLRCRDPLPVHLASGSPNVLLECRLPKGHEGYHRLEWTGDAEPRTKECWRACDGVYHVADTSGKDVWSLCKQTRLTLTAVEFAQPPKEALVCRFCIKKLQERELRWRGAPSICGLKRQLSKGRFMCTLPDDHAGPHYDGTSKTYLVTL